MEKTKKLQGQHALSRVYQKAWASGEKGDEIICTWAVDPANNKLEYHSINKYTVEFGEFFLPDAYGNRKDAFETVCNRVENVYEKLIKTVDNQGKLLLPHELDLKNFVGITLGRTTRLRNNIEYFLSDYQKRGRFIRMLGEVLDPRLMSQFLSQAVFSSISDQLKLMIPLTASYFSLILRAFSCVILRAPKDRFWHTADEPVRINWSKNLGAGLLDPYTEIFFPLSPQYMAFFFYGKALDDNSAYRDFTPNKVHDISEEDWLTVIMLIRDNAKRDLIICQEDVKLWQQLMDWRNQGVDIRKLFGIPERKSRQQP